jgi:hypothetical protein
MLNDDVSIISQSGELFFGRFHDQRYQKSQPDALRLIAGAAAASPSRWFVPANQITGFRFASFDKIDSAIKLV